jgi:hypothetical protein
MILVAHRGRSLLILFFTVLLFHGATAQTPTKTVNPVSNAWFSANNTLRFSNHWGMIADLHLRTRNFMSEPDFWFARAGVNYWFTNSFSGDVGYGHLWLMPTEGKHTVGNENRIHEQLILSQSFGRIGLFQRLRNEHRWVQSVANDEVTGVKYSDRVRYLMSLNLKLSKTNKRIPSIVLSDELMVQFGKQVVYNTFDQNRLFIGIREDIRPDLSFDFGYMRIFQQKPSPGVFERHDVLRLFFYWSPDLRKYFHGGHSGTHHPDDE